MPDDKPLTRDQAYLLKLARTRMPYGKHQGMLLVDLPEPYVVWMASPRASWGRCWPSFTR